DAEFTCGRVGGGRDGVRFAATAEAGEFESGDLQCEREVGREVSPDGGYLLQSQRHIHRSHVEADCDRLDFENKRLDVQRDRRQVVDARLEVDGGVVQGEREA